MLRFVLVILALIKFRLKNRGPVTTILLRNYGRPTLNIFRKLEKESIKLTKLNLQLSFLKKCKLNKIWPKFIFFRLWNTRLYGSKAYKKCQNILLNNEIRNKENLIKTTSENVKKLKDILKVNISILDFIFINRILSRTINNTKTTIEKVHEKKLFSLGLSLDFDNISPDKVIFNYSSFRLSEEMKNSLTKGLNFGMIPSKLNLCRYLLPFEKLLKRLKDSPLYKFTEEK